MLAPGLGSLIAAPLRAIHDADLGLAREARESLALGCDEDDSGVLHPRVRPVGTIDAPIVALAPLANLRVTRATVRCSVRVHGLTLRGKDGQMVGRIRDGAGTRVRCTLIRRAEPAIADAVARVPGRLP